MRQSEQLMRERLKRKKLKFMRLIDERNQCAKHIRTLFYLAYSVRGLYLLKIRDNSYTLLPLKIVGKGYTYSVLMYVIERRLGRYLEVFIFLPSISSRIDSDISVCRYARISV